MSIQYYEAVMISVELIGRYTFQSRSDFDTHGVLYIDRFDSCEPSINMLADDDDSAGDRQFSITATLQPEVTYILVVTTDSSYAYEMGDFEIIAVGPDSVEFIPIISPPTSSSTTATRLINRKD